MNKTIAILVVIIIFSITIITSAIYESEKNNTNAEFSELSVLSNTMFVKSVYAVGDCKEAIENIKAEYRTSVRKWQQSYFALGLVVGLQHIDKDCDTAKEVIAQVRQDMWNAYHEEKFDAHIFDKVTAGLRFVEKQL